MASEKFLTASRLSLGRYGSPNYYRKPRELFEKTENLIAAKESLPKFLLNFKKLFDQTQNEEQRLYDCVIKVEGDEGVDIKAQRQILIARSAFFENEIFDRAESSEPHPYFSLSELDDGIVEVTFARSTFKSIELLRKVICYIYWGYWDEDEDEVKDLFTLAAIFDLKELRNNAGEMMAGQLNGRNISEYILLAHKYDATMLKSACIKYLVQNRSNLDRGFIQRELIDNQSIIKSREERARLVAEIYRSQF